MTEGFEVNEETLGYDAITRVGIGGNYLQDEHTFKYLSKRFNMVFAKPQTKIAWRENGSKTMVETARERASGV